MTEFFARLRQRKLVQWAIAYVAFAFALIQVLDVVSGSYHWPDGVMHLVFGALVLGLVVALVLAWYHGERGAQRVSGAELLLITLALAIGGGLMWHFARSGLTVTGTQIVATSAAGPDAAQQNPEPTTPGSAVSALRAVSAQTAPIPAKSVAVLPFENLSGDPKGKYFSDGITEEILNALAQIPDLKVTARTSAFQFYGKGEDPRQISKTLGVANLLEGSVQKAGDEVRINVQLIDARTGYRRWSEKYDRKLTNIFAVEDDISNAVAGKLKVQLTGGAGQALVAQRTIDPRAHDFYLRGLSLLAARSMRDAADAFRQAVKLDPDYAQAWGGMAETEVLLPAYGLDSVAMALPRAQSAAQRAIALDPNTASAYVALGVVYSVRWQWPQADQAFHRALMLAPGDAEAVDQYAQFLYVVGQLEPALREIEHAQKLDPLSAVIGANRASILGALQRYDAAAAQMESTLAAHPDFALAHSIAAVLAVNRRRYAEAEAQIRLASKLMGNDPGVKALLERGIADPALRAAAVRSLETSLANAGLRRDPIVYALFLAQLGERDGALSALEGNVVSRSSDQSQLLWNPSFDAIRNDPRFKAVLKKMGLPYTPPGARTQ